MIINSADELERKEDTQVGKKIEIKNILKRVILTLLNFIIGLFLIVLGVLLTFLFIWKVVISKFLSYFHDKLGDDLFNSFLTICVISFILAIVFFLPYLYMFLVIQREEKNEHK